jgi:hypothetical protein
MFLNYDLGFFYEGSQKIFIIVIWAAITIVPGLILSFKRRNFLIFFFPALLNLIGWIIKIFYDVTFIQNKIQDIDLTNFVIRLFDNFPYTIFIIIGLIGTIYIEIYRRTFKYIIYKDKIEISFGIGMNSRVIPSTQIAEILPRQNFVEFILRIGNLQILTSTGMGTGDSGTLGGFNASYGNKNVRAGGFMGGIATKKDLYLDPKNCIFGISNLKKVIDMIKFR